MSIRDMWILCQDVSGNRSHFATIYDAVTKRKFLMFQAKVVYSKQQERSLIVNKIFEEGISLEEYLKFVIWYSAKELVLNADMLEIIKEILGRSNETV